MKIHLTKKMKIYLVKWFDAQSSDGWELYNQKEENSDMIIYTVGFLIDENKNYIRIGLSFGQNKNGNNLQFNGTMAIPKRCIIKKKQLK